MSNDTARLRNLVERCDFLEQTVNVRTKERDDLSLRIEKALEFMERLSTETPHLTEWHLYT